MRDRLPLWLFLSALSIYALGIVWGLPEGVAGQATPWGADELGPVGAINEAYGVFASRNPTFNPQYPLFHYLCQLVTVAPVYAGLWLSGHISMPAPSFPYGLDHPAIELKMLTLLARFPSLLMAAGIVAIAFRTGQVLLNRTGGVMAALLVLVQYPMFFYSRTSNVDMGGLFWTALGLLVFARCLADGVTAKRWMAFGVLAALATAAKDPAYAAFGPAGAVLGILHFQQWRSPPQKLSALIRTPALAVALAAAVYVVASGLIFRPSRFQQHLHFITTGTAGIFYFRYPATPAGYWAFFGEFSQQFVDALGVPALLAVLAGTIAAVARHRRMLLWMLPAVGVCLGVILPVRFALLRFTMIPAYVLAFVAADVFSRGWNNPGSVWRLTARAAFILTIAWSGLKGADLTYQMMFDGRGIVAEWLRDVTQAGDRIGHVRRRLWQLPPLPRGVSTQELTPDGFSGLTAENGPEFIVSMPLQDYEHVHELDFPADVYRRLSDNGLGYRNAGVIQGATLFRRRPATFVNPPVRIFVREDVWQTRKLANRSAAVLESAGAASR